MSKENLLITRMHSILAERLEQITLNWLAIRGGRPYINAQLWRAPNESDLSWHGISSVSSMSGLRGRKDRACIVNDAGRVSGKINQYLFKEEAERDGIGEEFAASVDGQKTTINQFWEKCSESLTASGWFWVQVDRGAALIDNETGEARGRTLLEKQRDGDFIRWILWPASSVVDWSFNKSGTLLWLLTESYLYENADPEVEAKTQKLRTLWQLKDGSVTLTQFVERDGKQEIYRDAESIAGLKRIPFELFGSPNPDPWWFDDVETIQAQCLNLDSLNIENHVTATYPQLVLAAGTIDALSAQIVERAGSQGGESVVEIVKEVVRGLSAPLVESAEESGITRYLEPSKASAEILPEEIKRKRQLLFDMVGLSLFNKEVKSIQTAESKQFDQLDTESTLRHRAIFLQESEERLVLLSSEIDPLFKFYSPVWPDSFDVVDYESDSQTILTLGNLPDNTPSMRKLVMMASLRLLEAVGGRNDDLIKSAIEEIESMEFDAGFFDTRAIDEE